VPSFVSLCPTLYSVIKWGFPDTAVLAGDSDCEVPFASLGNTNNQTAAEGRAGPRGTASKVEVIGSQFAGRSSIG
jgi:hypothetical protein